MTPEFGTVPINALISVSELIYLLNYEKIIEKSAQIPVMSRKK
jgi:hypothetical protein